MSRTTIKSFPRPARRSAVIAGGVMCALGAAGAGAQVEPIFGTFPGGPAGFRLVFPHVSAPGDTFTTFEFAGAATHADVPMSHILVIVFEWRDLPTDPWSSSQDNAFSIIGGMPNPVMTGIFSVPEVPGEVALHVYNGLPGGMTLAGDFTHLSFTPAPGSIAVLVGAGVLGLRRRR